MLDGMIRYVGCHIGLILWADKKESRSEYVGELHTPPPPVLPLPVPSSVHMHHGVGDGVKLLPEPERAVGGGLLQPRCLLVISVCCCLGCSRHHFFPHSTPASLLLLQSQLLTQRVDNSAFFATNYCMLLLVGTTISGIILT